MEELKKYKIVNNVLAELGLLIEYVPIPHRSEYEKSKQWSLEEQSRLDRRYLAAIKINEAYLMIYDVHKNKIDISNGLLR